MGQFSENGHFSVWFFFEELKKLFPDVSSYSPNNFWPRVRKTDWLKTLLTSGDGRTLTPTKIMSMKDFWLYAKKHEWCLEFLEETEKQNGLILTEDLERLLPDAYFYLHSRKHWNIFNQALEFFFWQLTAEKFARFKILVDDGKYYPQTVRGFLPPGLKFHYFARCPKGPLRNEVKKAFGRYYLPLVKNLAGRMILGFPPQTELADLVQVGFLGLYKALDEYNPELGVKFETYATYRIRGEILDYLRELDWVPRGVKSQNRKLQNKIRELEQKFGKSSSSEKLARTLGVELKDLQKMLADCHYSGVMHSLNEGVWSEDDKRERIDLIEDLLTPTLLETIDRQKIYEFLKTAIANELSPQQATVIRYYYWHELRLKAIGRLLKLCESRVSQIHTRAIHILRCLMYDQFGFPVPQPDGQGGWDFKKTPLPPRSLSNR
ncbi:FliA/WhiG family RNA polymerase sigma factor [Candidatus Parcubacteria bacterium]|jgi:RNA polymerase sigma factor for flagellar operon FliA|nr:MAG: FliA/WhiG family RNA polymerase sigma factor [Candidatus Parcubacteria bacterium]